MHSDGGGAAAAAEVMVTAGPLARPRVPPSSVEVIDARALSVLAGEAAAAQRAVNTRRSYAGVYRQFCAYLAAVHGRTPVLEDLAAQVVRCYRDQLEREGRSPATVAHHLSALRQLADRLDADPAIQRVHADRVAPREPRALERPEYERLLAMPDRRTVAGRRDLAVLYVLGEAGLRRSELCALSYDDVGPVRRHRDPRLRPAVATRPADHTEYVVHVRRAKRGKARTVPLSRRALQALLDWRDARPAADTDRVFISLPRTSSARPAPLSAAAVGAIVTKHAVRAQLPSDRLTAHVLRHTFCTLLAERGVALEDNSAINLMEIRSKCRRLKQEHGLSLVIVDYLQLMQSHRRVENRVQEVSELSRGLKVLAKELGMPVIALSQLSRKPEDRTDRRPQLADLRESGSIEQDADIVCFIYRDEVYNEDSAAKGEAELIVAKHRNGPLKTVRLSFLGHHSRFANMARGMPPGGAGSAPL